MRKDACNILIIDHADHVGGAELFALELGTRLNKRRYNVLYALTKTEILCGKNVAYVLYREGTLRGNPFVACLSLLWAIRDIRAIVQQGGIDIIQTNTVRTHILGVIVSIVTGTPLIWVHHSYDFPRLLFRLLSWFPKKIVYVSNTLRRDYERLCSRKGRGETIYNGIDLDRVQRTLAVAAIRDNNSAPNCKKVGIIGRIEYDKGQEYFIRCIPNVLKRFPGTEFVLIGEAGPKAGQYCNDLKEFVQKLGLENNVRFMGYVSDSYMAILGLDVVVQASIKPESFGRVLVEAMALGKPVIATRIGGFCEVIEDQRDGCLVPPGDADALSLAIIRALTDYPPEMLQAARKKVCSKYGIDAMTKNFEDLYCRVVQDRKLLSC
jgi:glycosyltransferase involved in cell wall biosynthesis